MWVSNQHRHVQDHSLFGQTAQGNSCEQFSSACKQGNGAKYLHYDLVLLDFGDISTLMLQKGVEDGLDLCP